MITNNFTEISATCKTELNKKFEEMATDCLNMIETDQITIDLAEDLMLDFINKVKPILTEFIGTTFSNLQIDNETAKKK
jgi:hypothetical protein